MRDDIDPLREIEIIDGRKCCRLSRIERTWALEPHETINFIVRLSGALTESKLRSAIEKAQSRWPILNANLQINEKKEMFWVLGDTLPVPIIMVNRESDDHWRECLIKEHTVPFKFDKKPMFRVTCLLGEVSDLIVRFHHSIGDGISVALFIREVLECLGDETRIVKTQEIIKGMEKSIIPEETEPVLENMASLLENNRWWNENKVELSYKDYADIREIEEPCENAGLYLIQMDKKTTFDILKKCKQVGVTMNTALVTAFQKAYSDNVLKYRGEDTKLHGTVIPMGCRDLYRIPVAEDFGFYSIGIYSELKYDSGAGFKSNALKFQQIINEVTSKKSQILKQVLVDEVVDDDLQDATIIKFNYRRKKYDRDRYSSLYELCFRKDRINEILKEKGLWDTSLSLILTNLGRFDFGDNYGDYQLKNIFLAQMPSPVCEQMVGVVTAVDKMNILFAYEKSSIEDKMAEDICSDAKLNLQDNWS